MIDFLVAPANMPFTIALCVMAGLAAVELISMLLGFALSHVVDSAFPGLDHDADVGLDLNHDGHISAGEHLLGWLHVGQVPVLILFVLLLLGFGLGGVVTQWVALNTVKYTLPMVAAVPVALLLGILFVRVVGGFAQKSVLKDESSSVSAESLLGHSATITLGSTRQGSPTQAKLKDKHGQTHYVLVEPLQADAEFHGGQSVVLVERNGHKYMVVEDSVEALLSFGANPPPAENRQTLK